ncbi:MAG: PhnD/SsuA/transferrin family substrate-binding protein, partial [Dermabacter sp.]|nr:PhnD/SsuA/transferrin family substrate-binding protein [Dermabacter sp.]
MIARRKMIQAAAVLPALSLVAACGSSENSARPLRVSAIPDQDPDVLTEREEAFAQYLATKLERDVEYVAVPDYSASVAQLGTGDLDLVFYGGLTGVQARKQSPDVTIIGQRDIDATFTSTFIANSDSGIEPV